jgi:hypothetical protein
MNQPTTNQPELKLATSVPRDFLEILGAVSVNFGALENALSVSIWFLLGDASIMSQDRYQIVTGQLSFKQLVPMLANLYRHRFPGRNEDKIKEFVKRCFNAESKRNEAIHSLWVGAMPEAGESKAMRLKITARSEGFRFKAEDFTKQQLIAVANQFGELAFEIQSFIIAEAVSD